MFKYLRDICHSNHCRNQTADATILPLTLIQQGFLGDWLQVKESIVYKITLDRCGAKGWGHRSVAECLLIVNRPDLISALIINVFNDFKIDWEYYIQGKIGK